MEEKIKITISNGYDLTVSAELHNDTDIHGCVDAVSRLLHAAGFSLHSIKLGMECEAERIESEIKSLTE